jgi:hypothetical protein
MSKPTDEEIDERTEAAIELYCELYGDDALPENVTTTLDGWAKTTEGQRQLKLRGIKNWW